MWAVWQADSKRAGLAKSWEAAQPSDAMIQDFLKRAMAYAKAAGLKPSTVSLYVFNDGKVIERLKRGGRIDVGALERGAAELEKMEKALLNGRSKTNR